MKTVLLVEDNPAQQRLMMRALRGDEFRCELHVVPDGEAAMDYLEGEPSTGVRRPDLILLDLNLPKLDGRQVLQRIKKNPALCRIPVIVVTTSQAHADVVQSYALGANSYIRKPEEMEDLVSTLRRLCKYWFNVAVLPRD